MATAQPMAFYNAPVRLFSTEGSGSEVESDGEAAE